MWVQFLPGAPMPRGPVLAYAGDPAQGEQRLWQFGVRVHF